jgi:hypothetical protein
LLTNNDGLLNIAKLRTLKRISVGALQFEAALFLGSLRMGLRDALPWIASDGP